MDLPRNLPQTDALLVEQANVQDYLLNLFHKEGGPMARFLLNRVFKLDAWEGMAEALRQHGMAQPVTETSETRFGRKFTVECQITTPDGRNPCILTAWIVEGRRPPCLVTAHPNS